MAKAKDDTRPVDSRPPVTTNPPADMAPPPPPFGETLARDQNDQRPPVDTNNPDGPPVQPPRPDQTTQGPRPNVGGSNPEQTHPDRPDIAGVRQFPEEMKEPDDLVEARKRAAEKGGNVYRVTKTLTTGHTGHVTESDFIGGDGRPIGDIQHMLKHGALEPVGDLKADPRTAHALGDEGMRQVDEMQARINELSADNDRLKDENDKMKAEISRLRSLKTPDAHK